MMEFVTAAATDWNMTMDNFLPLSTGISSIASLETSVMVSPSSSSTASSNYPVQHNDIEDILSRLSDERAVQLLPVFLIFAFVFVIGVWGNSLIVYIYWAKFKATWSRTAIVALGIFDLIGCLVAVPGEVVDLRFSFNYHSDVMCRILRACATFPNVASGIMLTTVAFDRYRLICTPYRASASRSAAWKHVLAVSVTSFMVTWPAAVIYGTMNAETGLPGVVGRECSTSQSVKNTPYPLLYNLVLSFIFLFAFISMIVFYSLIARQIYRQGEFRKTLRNMRDRKRKLTQSELEASLASDPDAGRDLSQADSSETQRQSAGEKWKEGSSDTKKKMNDSQPSSPTSPTLPSAPVPLSRKPSRTPSVLQRIRRGSSQDSRTRKTTLMLCFISIAFVLSFLPHLAVKLVRVFDKGFLHEASTGRLIAYNLCARSYFLNSFINVFIYGFCSFRFRKECMKVLRKLLFCKRRRY